MICEDRKLCFVHIPKCAGTSITRSLGFSNTTVEHRTLSSYVARQGYDNMQSFFKFCFVRNPWDRLVSWYYYHNHKMYKPRTKKMFRSWVNRGCPHHWNKLFHDDVNWSEDSPLRLSSWLSPVGPVRFDKIFKTEEYEEAISFLNEMLGINIKPNLLNKSVRGDYRYYYDDITSQKVSDLFSRDIAQFDYEF